MRRRQVEHFLRLTVLLVAAHVAAGAAGCARPVPIFSEQNARAHVGMLAGTIGSRPVGTEANARARAYIIDQLRLFGFEVRVQEADARRASLGRSARVANIIAVRAGARAEAVALVSHYDSVPMGPGAADDALGVAVSLEAARVLAARPNPNWSVMVLVTDAEEAGLMGAAALMTDRDVTNRLKAYINFEVDRVGRDADALRGRTGKRLAAPAVGEVRAESRAAVRSSPRSTSGCRTTPTSRSSSCRKFPGSTSPPSATASRITRRATPSSGWRQRRCDAPASRPSPS